MIVTWLRKPALFLCACFIIIIIFLFCVQGGLPSWLLEQNPQMQLRTNDASMSSFLLIIIWRNYNYTNIDSNYIIFIFLAYMSYVHRWLTVLMTRMNPLLYGNGGPIIMVQVCKFCVVIILLYNIVYIYITVILIIFILIGGKWIWKLFSLWFNLHFYP